MSVLCLTQLPVQQATLITFIGAHHLQYPLLTNFTVEGAILNLASQKKTMEDEPGDACNPFIFVVD
jgi:hypothetical protein